LGPSSLLDLMVQPDKSCANRTALCCSGMTDTEHNGSWVYKNQQKLNWLNFNKWLKIIKRWWVDDWSQNQSRSGLNLM